MRISDWSSDVCSSDLLIDIASCVLRKGRHAYQRGDADKGETRHADGAPAPLSNHALLIHLSPFIRSEEHTSELQSLMRISYAVFCLKKKKHTYTPTNSKLISQLLPTNTNTTTI